jgi:hypothetical protein
MIVWGLRVQEVYQPLIIYINQQVNKNTEYELASKAQLLANGP